MSESPASLPPFSMDMVKRLDNVVVTRAIKRPQRQAHSGAVYDSTGALVRQAQPVPKAGRKWWDPPSVAEALAGGRRVERRLKKAIYLGQAFTHFGHLLVETLPNLCWTGVVEADTLLLFHPFNDRCHNVFTEVPYGIAARQLLGIAPERFVMADIDLAVDELLLPPRAYSVLDGPLYDSATIELDDLVAAIPALSSRNDRFWSSSDTTTLSNGCTLVGAYDEYMKLRHDGVPFTLESVVTWMIMAAFAEAVSDGPGDHLELGVKNGGSAFLHMLLMRPEEEICLVDRQRTMIFDRSFRMLEESVQRRVHYVRALTTAPETDALRERSFRWIHIDAGHGRAQVLADLERYEPTLRGDGLLVMDDFFQGRLPEVTEAIYQFLHERQPNLRPTLVAFNKAYFCRSELYDAYLASISERLEMLLRPWGRFRVDDIRMNGCLCYHARGATDAKRRGSRR